MTRKEIKSRIEEHEYFSNGFHKLNGYHVKAVNLKQRQDKFIVDIIIHSADDNATERYNDCEYPKEFILKGREVKI